MARRCPLKKVQLGNSVVFGECDRDGCEWWNNNLKECAITSLSYIGFEMHKIKEQLEMIKSVI